MPKLHGTFFLFWTQKCSKIKKEYHVQKIEHSTFFLFWSTFGSKTKKKYHAFWAWKLRAGNETNWNKLLGFKDVLLFFGANLADFCWQDPKPQKFVPVCFISKLRVAKPCNCRQKKVSFRKWNKLKQTFWVSDFLFFSLGQIWRIFFWQDPKTQKFVPVCFISKLRVAKPCNCRQKKVSFRKWNKLKQTFWVSDFLFFSSGQIWRIFFGRIQKPKSLFQFVSFPNYELQNRVTVAKKKVSFRKWNKLKQTFWVSDFFPDLADFSFGRIQKPKSLFQFVSFPNYKLQNRVTVAKKKFRSGNETNWNKLFGFQIFCFFLWAKFGGFFFWQDPKTQKFVPVCFISKLQVAKPCNCCQKKASFRKWNKLKQTFWVSDFLFFSLGQIWRIFFWQDPKTQKFVPVCFISKLRVAKPCNCRQQKFRSRFFCFSFWVICLEYKIVFSKSKPQISNVRKPQEKALQKRHSQAPQHLSTADIFMLSSELPNHNGSEKQFDHTVNVLIEMHDLNLLISQNQSYMPKTKQTFIFVPILMKFSSVL